VQRKEGSIKIKANPTRNKGEEGRRTAVTDRKDYDDRCSRNPEIEREERNHQILEAPTEGQPRKQRSEAANVKE